MTVRLVLDVLVWLALKSTMHLLVKSMHGYIVWLTLGYVHRYKDCSEHM